MRGWWGGRRLMAVDDRERRQLKAVKECERRRGERREGRNMFGGGERR